MPGTITVVKSASEMSKKTLPTASTLIRACDVATFGTVTDCDPSFGVLSASTYGYVCPPSTDSVIFTFAVLTGATSVLAGFHDTVRCEPATHFAPALGPFTRNGPAVGASRSVVSALLTPPRPSRAVRRKWSDSGVAFTPAKPT